jgi:uncharacterized protein with HEPN domain
MRAALADIRQLTKADKKTFEADRVVQQAVAYNLAVLGEAARALSPELRNRYLDVPWRNLIAQRNLVHEYHRLDIDRIWITVRQDFPRLDDRLAAIETNERETSHADDDSPAHD